MYQLEWSDEHAWRRETTVAPGECPDVLESVASAVPLVWGENCLECAAPECYKTCHLYSARADMKCRRLDYGIMRNPAASGLFPYLADVRFRRWAKIGTPVFQRTVSIGRLRRYDRWQYGVSRAAVSSALALRPINQKLLKIAWAWDRLRNALCVRKRSTDFASQIDDLLLVCYSPPDQQDFRLIVELKTATNPFKEALPIKPGWNVHRIASHRLPLSEVTDASRLTAYPENDLEVRLLFAAFDLVGYAGRAAGDRAANDSSHTVNRDVPEMPAQKVKCVVWDLDNTLWNGILVEDGPDGVKLRDEAKELIKQLDERGIIQSISSKNNFEDAWKMVERSALDEFFLHPQISWRPKSQSMMEIARELNIGIDSLALIDDSPFERAEVKATLPCVRVYDEKSVGTLLEEEAFDVPITTASKQRRSTYVQEIKRTARRQEFGGDYDAFLKSCGICLKLFEPSSDADVERCVELMQRTNQLNLSGRRLDRSQFDGLLRDAGWLCVAWKCRDRFGDYGAIGVCTVDCRKPLPRITDMCISCRVAQKRVEHAAISWLAKYLRANGAAALEAGFVRTSRNGPLLQVFEDLPFVPNGSEEGVEVLRMDLTKGVPEIDVVDVESDLVAAV